MRLSPELSANSVCGYEHGRVTRAAIGASRRSGTVLSRSCATRQFSFGVTSYCGEEYVEQFSILFTRSWQKQPRFAGSRTKAERKAAFRLTTAFIVAIMPNSALHLDSALIGHRVPNHSTGFQTRFWI